MWRRYIAVAGGAAVVALVAGSASASSPTQAPPAGAPAAAPHYKLVKLGVLRGDEFSIPSAINARGDVVGYSGGLTQPPTPFRYIKGTKKMKAIPLPAGYTSGRAYDINDTGVVTGDVENGPGAVNEAIRWQPNGDYVLLGSLGTPADGSSGMGINNDGDVTGTSTASDDFEGLEAFRYTDADGIVSVTPGARPGFGYDINADGEISGGVEFNAVRILSDGSIQDISGALQGITTGTAINDSGQVAISQEVHDANDVWRWTPGVGLEDIKITSDDERVVANGINRNGDVVGLGKPIGSDNIRAAFLYRDGLGAVDLNDLLSGRLQKTWFLSEAWDINDKGQIVVEALNLKTFKTEAVRLDPVR